MTEPENCPYCGGSKIETFFQDETDPGWYFTECIRCLCRGPRSWTSQDSIGAWNVIPRKGPDEEQTLPTLDRLEELEKRIEKSHGTLRYDQTSILDRLTTLEEVSSETNKTANKAMSLANRMFNGLSAAVDIAE